MDLETYDQISMATKQIDGGQFMKEGTQVQILFNSADGRALASELPARITLEVTYTEPGVKGDTATNSTKAATVETGAEVRVPLFINQGDLIGINTVDGSYAERVKK
jgi:elongation factor P